MPPQVSFAQNGEDVVLWRAFAGRTDGRYVEVGANHPTLLSVSRSFYEAGWSGIEIEPQPALAAQFRAERPRDVVVEAAVVDSGADTVDFYEVVDGNGLSTMEADVAARHAEAGLKVERTTVRAQRLDALLAEHLDPDDDIHFLLVDVEGGEESVIRSCDWTRWRPWVLIVEAVAPINPRDFHEHAAVVTTHESWEPVLLDAGYQFCLFDGLSRFYVADEHADLKDALSVPASWFDEQWVPHKEALLHAEVARLSQQISGLNAELAATRGQNGQAENTHREQVDDLIAQLTRWRSVALSQWLTAAGTAGAVNEQNAAEVARLNELIAATHQTLSWRVTEPLRAVRRAQLRKAAR